MKHEAQIKVLEELIDMIDNKRSPDAGRMVKNPTAQYVCKERAEKEWDLLFQNHAQIIGMSGDLPEPGSFFTLNDLEIPILATRDKEGKFHAFVNACRHRGAVLTEEERGKQHRFSCPFHAWTYNSEGELLGIRAPKDFGEVDKSCHGLVELPSQEKYGFLVIHPQVDGQVDIDELLGEELSEELSTWELNDTSFLVNTPLEKRINWKICVDTFGENYHFHSLHTDQLDAMFHGDATGYYEYGRNHCLVVASRYLDVLREKPREMWSTTDAGIMVYYLFPNTILALFNRVATLVRIYPVPGDPTRSVTRISHYSAPNIGAKVAEEAVVMTGDNMYQTDMTQRVEFSAESQVALINSTLEHEDYYMAEKSQIAAESGKVEYFIFGRNEPALHHFHNGFREALGEAPLEEYKYG